VDSKAECGQLNLAHVGLTKNKTYKKETKTTNKRSAHLIRCKSKIHEGGSTGTRKTMEKSDHWTL